MSEKSNPTIADKITKLNDMVAWFDGDEFVLEDAVVRFAEVEKLAEEIENDLKQMKNTITVVKKKFSDG